MLGIEPLSASPLSALPLSSGASYSIPAALGIFTLTGNSAGLARGLKAGVTVGDFTLTGNSAGLSYGANLQAGVGSFTLTGEAANLKHNHNIAGGAGGFTLTGNSAGLALGKKMPAALGTYTIAGVAASFSYTPANLANYVLEDFEDAPFSSNLTWYEDFPDSGGGSSGATTSYTRTSSNVTEATYSWRINGDADGTTFPGLQSEVVNLSGIVDISIDVYIQTNPGGSIVFGLYNSGATNLYEVGEVGTGAKTITIIGTDAVAAGVDMSNVYIVFYAFANGSDGVYDFYVDNINVYGPLINTLQPTVGTFTLTGVNANLKSAHTIYNGAGAITLTGVDTSLTKGIRLPASVASFTLTGVDVAFTAPLLRMPAEVGSISVTGNNAGLKKGYKTAGGVGSLTLSGVAVAFAKTSRTLTAEQASFVLAAPVASIRKGSTMTAAVGSFALTGVAASFEKVTKITCTAGEIEAFGPPPHLTTTGKFWASRSNRIDRHDIVF